MKDKEIKDQKGSAKPDRSRGKRDFKSNREKFGKSESKLPCMNDPSWYVLHPDLIKDAASLPFSHFLGRGFPLLGNNAMEGVITKINYLYMLGITAESGDPVNLAIRNLYTYVRHQNSGHTNYESADLGIYLLATAGVIATLAHLERLIGLAKCYQRRSSVMPLSLLNVLGVNNTAAFIANLANYTLRLNVMWQRVSSLCIPKDFSFLKRWIWMNSQVFKDHESDKAAFYVFKPVGVPTYNHFTLDAGSISQPVKEALTPTIDDWFNDCETALSSILDDEDMNIMSGDILKAYGSENLLHFGLTPIDYVLEPVFVEEMLPQIEHLQTPIAEITSGGPVGDGIRTGINYEIAQAINDPTNSIYVAAQDDDYFTIYQWNGEVVCTPVPSAAGGTATIDSTSGALYWKKITDATTKPTDINCQDRVLTSRKVSVPPEDVMIATRLMYTSDADTRISGSPIYYTSCGSELVLSLITYYNKSGGNLNLMGYSAYTFYNWASAGYLTYLVNIESVISQFDWRPLTYVNYRMVIPGGGGSNVTNNINVFGDVDNFTVVSPATLAGMHLTALLAEFSVTQYNLIK